MCVCSCNYWRELYVKTINFIFMCELYVKNYQFVFCIFCNNTTILFIWNIFVLEIFILEFHSNLFTFIYKNLSCVLMYPTIFLIMFVVVTSLLCLSKLSRVEKGHYQVLHTVFLLLTDFNLYWATQFEFWVKHMKLWGGGFMHAKRDARLTKLNRSTQNPLVV